MVATSPSSLIVKRLPHLFHAQPVLASTVQEQQPRYNRRYTKGKDEHRLARTQRVMHRVTLLLQHEQSRRPHDRSVVHPSVVRQRILGTGDKEIHQPDGRALRLQYDTTGITSDILANNSNCAPSRKT
jgi:hypothetical protein